MDKALTRLLWNKTGYLLKRSMFFRLPIYFLAIFVDDWIRKHMMFREHFCWPQLEGLYHQAYRIFHEACIPLVLFVKGMILRNEILRTGNDLSI